MDIIYSTCPTENIASVLYRLVYGLLPVPWPLIRGSGWVGPTLTSDKVLSHDPEYWDS